MAIPTVLLEIGLVIAWSSGFIGSQLAADAASVFLVLFWRFLLLSVLLMPWLVSALRNGLTLRSMAIQSVLGLLAVFGYLALAVRAVELGVPLGTAALVSALQPIVTAAFAGPLLRERITSIQWLGLAIGLGGVAFAVGGALGVAPWWAYAFCVVSMLSLVAATIIAKAVPDSTPLLPSLAIQCIVSAILFAPLAWLDGTMMPSLEPGFVGAVVWFILFSTIGGYGLYWICLQRTTATRVGSLIYLTPPVTMIWAWAMFSQPIAMSGVIGFVICILGVYLARPRQMTANGDLGWKGGPAPTGGVIGPEQARGDPAPRRP